MQLFYAPDITPPLYTLSEEESKHCVRVLRLGRGDTLHITDGRGNLFCCQITDDNPKRCTVRVTTTQAQWEPLPYRLVMAVAPTKNADRFEWFLEKATEVGVSAIVPLETEHSYRPELHPLTPFREAAARPFEGRKFIAHCAPALSPAGKIYLPATLRKGESALVFIGPEGDFSDAEIAFARANGFEEITLGTQRLRTETAAVVATVMASVANAGQ